MPALIMRGRYLMREYWSDSDLFLRLTSEQREVYVGLWTLADDDGWMPRDVPAIAAALFRYEDRAPREARVRDALDRLRAIGKLVSHRCGCLWLPSVSKYPRAGKKNTDHHVEHRTHSNRVKPIRADTKPLPDPTGTDPSLPDVAGASAPDGATPASDFKSKVGWSA